MPFASTSLRRNVVFNYAGQMYAVLVHLLVLPLYLRVMGAEAYGLVGFFLLVQGWMQLLDMGLSPTLGREVARLRESASRHRQLLVAVRSLESCYLFIALMIGAGLFMARDWIATQWLRTGQLDPATVAAAVAFIAGIVTVRLLAAFSRSGISAYEAQVWLNVADSGFATLRYPGALLLLHMTGGDILAFFGYQLLVAVGEYTVIRRRLARLLPRSAGFRVRFSARELRRLAPFALGIGYTGAVWVVVSHLDRLLLSRLLPLEEFGYFSLVAAIALGLTLLFAPLGRAVLPRITALHALGREEEMLRLYRKATRFVVAIVAPVTLTIALNPHRVLMLWTGDESAASWAAPVLPLFVLGSALLALITFQYYLQYAHGVLRYHVVYNTALLLLSVPSIVYAALQWGALGVGWVWLGFRVLSLVLWVPFIHSRFAPGLHWRWLGTDVFPGVAIVVICWFVFAPPVVLDSGGGRITDIVVLLVWTAAVTGLVLLYSFAGALWKFFHARLD